MIWSVVAQHVTSIAMSKDTTDGALNDEIFMPNLVISYSLNTIEATVCVAFKTDNAAECLGI